MLAFKLLYTLATPVMAMFFALSSAQTLAQASVRDLSSSSVNDISSDANKVEVRASTLQQSSFDVTEANPAQDTGVGGRAGTVSENSSHSNNLAFQVQQLQQEILELRGLVEKQGFDLRQLKQQRLDDYLDLDERIVAINKKLSQSSEQANQQATNPQEQTGQTSDHNGSALYAEAIDHLLNRKDYPAARKQFIQYRKTYPAGQYMPNTLYWLGQIYLLEKQADLAEESFGSLIKQFPDDAKAADAKYKLATIYFDQGKKDQSKVLLQEIAKGDSDASRLAKSFLNNRF